MAHLGNNPGQQDAGEILLTGFTQMALQMEAQRRLMKPGSKPRRGKKGQKKQPQRGLGVAQLEKIRLEEQRRASQQAQQLAALRQLHTGTPLYTHLNAPMPASTSIIPQLERESSLTSFLMPAPPVTSSAVAHIPAIDSIANSFLLKNASPFSSIVRPSTPVTPLDLFPSEKFQATSSMRTSDRNWADRNFYILHAPASEGRAVGENPQSLLALSCNQSNEGQTDRGPSYPFFNLRQNTQTSTNELCHPSQVHSRLASPSFSLERMMELSSFQSAVSASSRGDQHTTLKKRACGVVRPLGSQLSDLPVWMTPFSHAHSKPSQVHESHGSSNADVCELTLMPPGGALLTTSMNKQQQLRPVNGPNSFLSLAVGSTWQDSMAESSSTPSPVSATTTKSSANDTSTDEYMSPSMTGRASLPDFFPINQTQPKELQVNLFSSLDTSLDLNLKL